MSGTLPINISDTDFTEGAIGTTPLAKISTRFAEAVINTAWNEARAMKGEYTAKVSDASDTFLSGVSINDVTSVDVPLPIVTPPNVNIPPSAEAADVMTMFDTKYLELVALLSEKFAAFQTEYFPDEHNAYVAAENWLQEAVANPSAGLPPSVVAQVWGDDQARILSDKSRAQDAVLQQFAARRFPLPPGAAASAVLQIEQKAQDELAASSRKVAVMSIELQKFNVEKLLNLRQLAMASAGDYVKALASGPDMASKLVSVGYDAQSKLISAAADFYRADVSAKEMVSRVQQFNSDKQFDASVKNQAVDVALVEDRLKALLSEANAVAQMATSLFNNVHASAGISVST